MTIEKAVALGGLTVLRGDTPEHLDAWAKDAGRAAVMVPHGPEGLASARQAVGQHGSQHGSRRQITDSARDGVTRERAVDIVSFQWLRECVHKGRQLSVTRHPIFAPCPHELPLPGFSEKVDRGVVAADWKGISRVVCARGRGAEVLA
jgi:hypothetical protein